MWSALGSDMNQGGERNGRKALLEFQSRFENRGSAASGEMALQVCQTRLGLKRRAKLIIGLGQGETAFRTGGDGFFERVFTSGAKHGEKDSGYERNANSECGCDEAEIYWGPIFKRRLDSLRRKGMSMKGW